MLTRAEAFWRAVFLVFIISVLLMDLLVWRPN
jgi:hypothetical protein